MADTSNPADFNAVQNQMLQQLDALEAQKGALRAQFNPPTLLPKEMQHGYTQRFNNQLQGIQNQIDSIHRQFRMATQQQQHLVMDQNRAEKVATAQQKYQEAQKKAADASRKTALKETQDKLAGILGTKPKDLQEALGDAVYDPNTHHLIIPKDTKAAKDSIQDAKDNARTLTKELQEYAPDNIATGKKTPIAPGTFFGPQALPYTTDSEGNRLYTRNGKPFVTLPKDDAQRFEELYKGSIARPDDVSRVVSPDVFNQARAQIGMLGGDVPEDIVGQAQGREERARLAAPAFAPTTPGFAPGLLPNQRVTPNGVATLAPALVDNSDLLQPNITQKMKDGTVATVGFQPNALGNTEFAPPPMWQGTDTRLDAFRPGYVTKEQAGQPVVAALSAHTGLPQDKVLAIQAAGLKNGYAVDSPETQEQLRAAAQTNAVNRIPSLLGQGYLDVSSMMVPGVPGANLAGKIESAVEPSVNRGIAAITPSAEKYQAQLDLMNQYRTAQGLEPIANTINDPVLPDF